MKITDFIKPGDCISYIKNKQIKHSGDALSAAYELFVTCRPELKEIADEYCKCFGANYGTTIAIFQLLEEISKP